MYLSEFFYKIKPKFGRSKNFGLLQQKISTGQGKIHNIYQDFENLKSIQIPKNGPNDLNVGSFYGF